MGFEVLCFPPFLIVIKIQYYYNISPYFVKDRYIFGKDKTSNIFFQIFN